MSETSGVGIAQRECVVVFGTLNIDHVWSVPTLPHPGETILAKDTRVVFGGKGANQAVAAARQGARVALVGAVGGDADGSRYIEHLNTEGIDTRGIVTQSDAATGSAHVYVDESGENLIVVDGGANRLWDESAVDAQLLQLLATSAVLLAQLEAPVSAVRRALTHATVSGVRTILNASPFTAELSWDQPIDTVIVNEHECEAFFGVTAEGMQNFSSVARAHFLREKNLQHLVVTRGGESTLHFSAEVVDCVPVYKVTPLDTVGAGDTFAGALAAQLAQGRAWSDALRHANVSAALSTLSLGAQSAMPTFAQTRAALEDMK
jgi:ribokinase